MVVVDTDAGQDQKGEVFIFDLFFVEFYQFQGDYVFFFVVKVDVTVDELPIFMIWGTLG